MKVKELMNKELIVTYKGKTIFQASKEMATSKRGLLPVLNNMEERKVIGILSNTDIINKVISQEKNPSEVFVSDVMIKEPISVGIDATTHDAMKLMREYKIKRVLVMNLGVLQGIISSNDILTAMLKYKKDLLEIALEF